MTSTHIETIELTASQSSITFSSIPQDYDDLIIKMSLRSSGVGRGIRLRLGNGTLNTGSNYTSLLLQGNGTSVITSVQTTTELYIGVTTNTSTTSNIFSVDSCYIPNYTSATNKSISADSVSENNATQAIQFIDAGFFSTSSAIDIAQIFLSDSADLAAGCTASLYGITAGGDGTVTT